MRTILAFVVALFLMGICAEAGQEHALVELEARNIVFGRSSEATYLLIVVKNPTDKAIQIPNSGGAFAGYLSAAAPSGAQLPYSDWLGALRAKSIAWGKTDLAPGKQKIFGYRLDELFVLKDMAQCTVEYGGTTKKPFPRVVVKDIVVSHK